MQTNTYSNSRGRRRTITRTFRIKSEWDDVLQEESARQGVSINVLVNNILRRYSLFSRWIDRNSDIVLPQRNLREIINEVPNEKLAEIATNSGVFAVNDVLSMIGYEANYDSLNYLLTEHYGGPNFARWFTCFHSTHITKDIFHLQHDLGQGWSIYLDNYFTAFLKSLNKVDAETKVYDYAVTFKVKS
jgi:hypothetical protein